MSLIKKLGSNVFAGRILAWFEYHGWIFPEESGDMKNLLKELVYNMVMLFTGNEKEFANSTAKSDARQSQRPTERRETRVSPTSGAERRGGFLSRRRRRFGG